jgi:arylformamidase
VGRATVIDVSDITGEISAERIVERAASGDLARVLLRSNRSIANGTFPEAWPSLAPDALEYLLGDGGMKLLGTDSPSVDDRHSKALRNHRTIFGAGAYVLENLDLRATEPGVWELLALPLNVAGLDAAPVRAFLRTIS